ncbi:unnamed protein product (macronuclear) [Paramecium tetraurelia]|uniref:MIF4G domain-containing protein n=1 Tax=Paramecium tetraurelia TaxID=5888 RepID=A0BH49_PARTE|nr:uncharacterized protein GSPATT00028901001 [Paramecium tetraurelia]CAK57866.1 unnamed protein product [Paramecium tetraurelia]|eukprot:XP_001425264.1 hypothetical protein (macronuclear) [Paramecium tetraurelia strain d4-2]
MNKNNRSEELLREQYCKTQAERILDKQLFKKTKGQHLHQMEKQIYGDQNKKVKVEESSQKEQMSCQQAMGLVLKYLNNDNKIFTALNKIKLLIKEFKNKFYDYHLLQILYCISITKYQFKQHECDQLVIEIFDLCQMPQYTQVMDILRIQLQTKIKLQTDDTYLFNNMLKELKKIIDDLNTLQALQPVDILKLNSLSQIEAYEYEILPEFDQFINDKETQRKQQQQYVINCLEVLIDQFKYQWAKTSIHTFIQNLNFNQKQQFDESFRKQIDDIISKIQNAKILYNASNDREMVQNAKVMQDYLKPIHDVVDSRAVVNTGDGLDQWGLKQTGL